MQSNDNRRTGKTTRAWVATANSPRCFYRHQSRILSPHGQPNRHFGLTSLSPEILKAINTGYLSQEEILGNTPLTTEETIRQTAIAIVGRVRNNMRQKLGLFEETAEPENEWLGLLDKAVSEETNPEEKARLNRALKRIRLVWNNLQRLTDPANAISLDVEPGDEHNPPMLNFSKPR